MRQERRYWRGPQNGNAAIPVSKCSEATTKPLRNPEAFVSTPADDVTSSVSRRHERNEAGMPRCETDAVAKTQCTCAVHCVCVSDRVRE